MIKLRLSFIGIEVLVNIENQEIKKYLQYRYSGFCREDDGDGKIVICEKKEWSNLAKILFLNLRDRGKYAMCRNYKVITQDDYTIEVFEDHLYILSDKQNQTIEFYCPSNEDMTRVVASRLCVHLHMLMWKYGFFCLHGGATTYNNSTKKGIAIFGDSGTGKTSLVLSLCLYGEKLVADDNLFISTKNEEFVAAKNTQCIGLDSENLFLNFPFLCSYVVTTGIKNFDDKKRIDLLEFEEDLFVDQLEIKYIVLLHKAVDGKASVEIGTKASCIKYLTSLVKPYEGMKFAEMFEFIFLFTNKCIPLHVYVSSDVTSTRSVLLGALDNIEKGRRDYDSGSK